VAKITGMASAPPDSCAAVAALFMVGWHRILPTDVERRLFHISRYAAFARRYRALSESLVVGEMHHFSPNAVLQWFPSAAIYLIMAGSVSVLRAYHWL